MEKLSTRKEGLSEVGGRGVAIASERRWGDGKCRREGLLRYPLNEEWDIGVALRVRDWGNRRRKGGRRFYDSGMHELIAGLSEKSKFQ